MCSSGYSLSVSNVCSFLSCFPIAGDVKGVSVEANIDFVQEEK